MFYLLNTAKLKSQKIKIVPNYLTFPVFCVTFSSKFKIPNSTDNQYFPPINSG